MNDETRIRTAAFNITARFEGGGYHTYQNYDAGIISYGRFQFTLASGALGRIIEQYLAQSNTPAALALRAYHSRITARDPNLRNDQQLRELLVAAAREPMMQQIQDAEAARTYWEPTKQIAILPRGLQTPLAWVLLFDISINFGVGDGFLRMAERDFGVPERSRVGLNGISEGQLILRVAELRKISHDRQAERDNLPGLRVRGDFWLNLVRQGDWQLQGDANGNIIVKGQPIQVRTPGDTPQPDEPPVLDPTRFYITPTADRIRVRKQPVNGDTAALVSMGEIIEVLEPYPQAAPKVGTEGQWLHIRTRTGVEGYTAAWLYTVHQVPEQGDILYIAPTENRIRVRTQPISGDTVGHASQGDVLQVLEPAQQALLKLGKEGQWLHVRLPNGQEGYTAAWFYTAHQGPVPQPEPEPAPTPEPQPTPEKLYITPTENRVRIRTRPVDGDTVGSASQGDILQALDPPAQALDKIGVQGQWLHVRLPNGTEGYSAAWFYTVHQGPAPAPTPDDPLLITPTDDRVRIRAQPVDGEPLGLVSRGDVLYVLDPPAEALEKIGVEDQWLQVEAPDGTTGYTAAWFFKRLPGPLPTRKIEANLTGVNLDMYHPLGNPSPGRLGRLGWLRLPYNVSLNPSRPQGDPLRYGNTDLEATYQRYFPLLSSYARAGYKIMLVLTHQTFGEAAGYQWESMTASRWRDHADKFTSMAGQIAARFRGQGIVHAYQIWNEMDAPPEARASVPIPSEHYAYLLAQSIRVIRAADPEVMIITGGHTTGPELGVAYAQQTLQALPPDARPDGIAMHSYGRGDAQSEPRFRPYGTIDDDVNAYAALMPGWPVWITEWGVLDAPHEPPEEVALYARQFVTRLKKVYAHKVAAAIWFAWAQGMDNGYGIVDENNSPRGSFTQEFIML